MKKYNRSRKLNRSRRGVEQRATVAVFTEGRITEPQYVKVLKGIYRGVNVQIIERYAGSSPKILVEKALDYQGNFDEYDEIWCLFDKNDHQDEYIEEVIQKARKNNIMTAITNPCFELWLVLHQEDQFGYVSKEDIQKRSQTLGLTNNKHLSEIGKKLSREKYDDAKTRALHIQNIIHKGIRKPWANPSSQVWKFVDRLAELSNQSGT